MTSRPLALACALLALVFGTQTPAHGLQTVSRRARLSTLGNGELVLTGKRFEVHVHFDDIRVAKRALAVVETVWPVAMELLDAEGTEPPYPLEVHVYPDHRSYVEVERLLTDGFFSNNGSFAHWNSKTAHLEMSPPLHGRAAEKIVLSGQTREVLLHEAAHLAVYVVIPTYRWHPQWFSEGLATYVEQEAARRLGWLKGAGDHPRYSTDQMLLQRLHRQELLPSVSRIFADDLGTLTFHERYALQLELFDLLVNRRPAKYGEMIAEAKRLPGGGGFRQGLAAFVADTFDLTALDAELRRRVKAFDPDWYMDYRSFHVEGDLWTQAAFPDQGAVVWNTEPVGGEPYELHGSVELLGPEMSVLLDHRQRGWDRVEVAYRSAGEIVVRRVESQVPRELLSVPCDDLRRPEPHAFTIAVDKSLVRVSLGGVERLELRLPMDPLTGRWGLATPPGGAGQWYGVHLKR